ncbi:hypothetical protein [Pseudomonas sp. BEA3.1]|uniref:hypothetical protein n=1 Tax=Pseudomonas sp. BEA3.1 TaxID=3083251 RepID=UPI002964419C|nr:hypothetical protein [Pseudomonas sp. BEA3.1]MDW2775209.1 hypothetical protein [Pseudomonas sp. BEA3.1]
MADFNDTQRLDFILARGRQVVLEGMGTNGRGTFFYELYVQEGIWPDSKYACVHLEGPDDFQPTQEQNRQAIDLAMEAQP